MSTNSMAILYPVFALAGLTALVQVLIPITRVRAALKGRVTVADFTYGESAAVPPEVSLPNRNYMNLLEFPILLYVGCLLAYVAAEVTPLMLMLAWGFVGGRAVHSLIHLTYNHVGHRGIVFGISNTLLVAFWVVMAIHLR